MTPNFEEILLELSYRVPTGIVDLTNEEHLDELTTILEENGIYNSQALNALREKAKSKPKAPAKKVLNKIKPKSTSNPKAGESPKFKGYYHRGGGYYSKQPEGEITHKSDSGSLRALNAKEKAEKNKGIAPQPKKQPKANVIKVSDAEKRLGKSNTTKEPLAKDLNKALNNISDAKKKIQTASVQKGKMSQKDLDATIDVATKIAKGIDLNVKEKKIADTYIRIKDKK
jgi:hypothetical protein